MSEIGPCAYCGKTKTLTRDHIIPRAWGGTARRSCGTSNIKMACATCNEMRGMAQHCTGVMLMARAEAQATNPGGGARKVLARWGYTRYGFYNPAKPPPAPPKPTEWRLLVKVGDNMEEHSRGSDKEALVQIGREQFPGRFHIRPITRVG